MTGGVVWITGLSNAGKTTVAKALCDAIANRQLVRPILLDGDVLRAVFGSHIGYSQEDRRYLAGCYGRLCSELALQGHLVVCATISMFHDVRKANRDTVKNYVEVYLRVPFHERKNRDGKGVYTDREVDDFFEEPDNAEIIIDNHGIIDIAQAVADIQEQLLAKKII